MMCLGAVIFPVALSAFSPCCHVQNTHLLSTVVHGRDTKQGLGLALRLRDVFGSISGRKMDSDVLTWHVCSSLGLPKLGLHEPVCMYLWETPILLSADPGQSEALLPVPFIMSFSKLQLVGDFLFLFDLCFVPQSSISVPPAAARWCWTEAGQGAGNVTPPCVSTGCRCCCAFSASILCFPSAQTCQNCQNPCVGAFSKLGSEAFGSCNYTNKALLTTTSFACFTVLLPWVMIS